MYRRVSVVACAGVTFLAPVLGGCGSSSTGTSAKPARGFTGTTVGSASSLNIDNRVTGSCLSYGYRGDCWGTLTGSGLKPNSTVRLTDAQGSLLPVESADANGTLNVMLGFECQFVMTGVTAKGTTQAGAPITSTPVDWPSPCPIQ
jgi:hypothetical protein